MSNRKYSKYKDHLERVFARRLKEDAQRRERVERVQSQHNEAKARLGSDWLAMTEAADPNSSIVTPEMIHTPAAGPIPISQPKRDEFSGMPLRDRISAISRDYHMPSGVESDFVSDLSRQAAPRVSGQKPLSTNSQGFNLVSDVIDPRRDMARRQYDDATFESVASALDSQLSDPDQEITREYLKAAIRPGQTENGEMFTINGVDLGGSREYAEHLMDRYYEYRNHDRLLSEDPEYRERFIREISHGMSPDQYKAHLIDRYRRQLDEITRDSFSAGEDAYENPAISLVPGFHGVPKGKTTNQGEVRKINDLYEQLRSMENNDDWFKAFLSGTAESWNWADVALLGLPGIASDLSQLSSLNKYQKLLEQNPRLSPEEIIQTLDPHDQRMVRLSQLSQNLEDDFNIFGGRSTASRVGESLGNIGEFAVQMGLTGGIGNAVAGALKAGSSAAKRATYKIIKNSFQQSIRKGLLETGEMIGRNAGYAAVSAAAQTPFMPMTYKSFSDRSLAQYRWDGNMLEFSPESAWTRLWKSNVDTFAEVFSEKFEGPFRLGTEAVGRGLSRILFLDKFTNKVDGTMRGFWQRHPGLSYLHDRLEISGPITETISESIGDLVHPLLSGERERWNEMASTQYWWELALSSTVMSATMNSPSLIAKGSHVFEISRMSRNRNRAMEKIQSPELRQLLWDTFPITGISDQSSMLSGFDWRSVSAADCGNALDYIQQSIGMEILQGEEQESARLERFKPSLDALVKSVYRGADADKPDFGGQLKLVVMTTSDGASYPVISGDYSSSDGVFYIIDDNGKKVPRSVGQSDGATFTETALDEVISTQYAQMFGSSIQREKLENTISTIREAAKSGSNVQGLITNSGYHIYQPGDEVSLTDGVNGTVRGTLENGGYVVDRADKQTVQVGFEDVLQPDSSVAKAQIDIANGIPTKSVGNQSDSAIRVGDIVKFGDQSGTVTQKLSGGRYVILMPDGEYQEVRSVDITGTMSQEDALLASAAPEVSTAPPAEEVPASSLNQETISTPATSAQKPIPTKSGEIDYEEINDPEMMAEIFSSKLGSPQAAIEEIRISLLEALRKLKKAQASLEKSKDVNKRMNLRDQIDALETKISIRNLAIEHLTGKPSAVEEEGGVAEEISAAAPEVEDAEAINIGGQQGSAGNAATGERIESDNEQNDNSAGTQSDSGQLRNDEERKDSLSEVVEISSAERTEMETRIVDWLSEENLSRAVGKSREEIFNEFGNELMPIAYIPTQFISLVSPTLKDQRIYCGKGYFIDHALRNHAGVGEQVSIEDVDVSKYLNIQAVLDNPDHIKETYVDGKRTVVFIKKIGRFFAELTQVEESGKVVLHKSFFNQKKEPYAKLNDIRQEDTSSEGGTSSISHTAETAPAISLQSRGDVMSNDDYSSISDSEVTTNLPISNELGEKIAEAEAEVNTNPTEKQKEAGNYKKGHVQIGTFNVTIEQPKGSVRSGVDKGGKKWEVEMQNTYGYIRGTEGVDGDHIDVFLSDDIDGWNGRQVYVIDQRNEDGTFDEHKVMLGFNDINDAEAAYLSNYEEGWQGLGAITGVAIEDFEKWIASSHRKTKAFTEYKSVSNQPVEEAQPTPATERSKAKATQGGLLIPPGTKKRKPLTIVTPSKTMFNLPINLFKYVSKDKVNVTRGVLLDSDQYLVSTDGHILIAVKAAGIRPSDIGKFIDSKMQVIASAGLNWRPVIIPKDGQVDFIIDFDAIAKEVSKAPVKEDRKKAVRLNLGDKSIVLPLKEVLALADFQGAYGIGGIRFQEFHNAGKIQINTGANIALAVGLTQQAIDLWDVHEYSATPITQEGEKAPIEMANTNGKKISLEQYLGRLGLSSPVSDFMLDKQKLPRLKTQGERERFEREADQAANEYTARRQAAIAEYAKLVETGEIIAPTSIDRALVAANGHEDLDSTRAARNILNKRGIDWRTGDPIDPELKKLTTDSIPEGVSPDRWNVLVDHLKSILGAENVITDPETMRFVFEALTGPMDEVRPIMVKSTNERFNQLLEELSEENADRTIFDLGNPSPAMLSVGISNRPLKLNGNKLIKKAKQHKFSPQAITNLPQVIENPIAIFKGSYEGSFAILVELNINGSNVLATVDINKASELNVNLITSVYGKEKHLVAKWIDSGKALYIDKEKALNYLISPALIAGDPSNTGLDGTAKIVQNFKNPTIEPQDLRQSIFGYHGSGEKFDRFDRSFMGTGEGHQAYGYGFYITEVEGIAKKYASLQIRERKADLEQRISNLEQTVRGHYSYIEEDLKPALRKLKFSDPYYEVTENAIRFSLKEADRAKRAIERLRERLASLEEIPQYVYSISIPDDTGENYLPFAGPIGKSIAERINDKLSKLSEKFSPLNFLQSGLDAQNLIADVLNVHRTAEEVSDLLSSVGLVGVSYPAQFVSGGREDGAKNYVIFNSEDAKITEATRLFKTAQGEVYGFTVGGKIYLDSTRMTVEAPIHEYTELWSTIVARENPKLWERGKRLIMASNMWKEVNNDPNYRDQSEDARVSEALSRIVAAEAAGEAKKISSAKHIVDGIRSWLKKFWGYLKQTFSSWSSGDLDALTLDEFTKLPLRDFVEGINISDYLRAEGTGARLMFIGESGARALDRAEEANQRLNNLAIAREMEADFEERKERLEKLRNAKPVEITGNEIEPSEDLEQYRKNARAYANQLRGEYTNADTGAVVEVNRSSIKETLHHDYKDIPHLVSVAAIPQIIENGIFITSERNSGNKNVERFDYYITGLRIGRVDYTVKFVVSIQKDGSRYYDHKLTQIEKGRLLDLSAISSTESANKAPISEVKDKRLLDIIQTNPKENARKIKMATGWERGADSKWRYETEDSKLNERTVDRMKNELSYQQQAVCMLTDLFERGSEIFSAYPDLQKLRVVVKKGESVIPEGQLEWADEPYDRQIVLSEAVIISHFATDALDMYSKADRKIIRVKQGINPITGETFDSAEDQRDALARYTAAADEWLEKYRKYSESRLRAASRILAHEVQHAVQFMEGFARGANVQEFQDMRMEVLRSLNFHTDGSLLDGSAISDAKSLREALSKEILPGMTLKEAYAHNLQRVARRFGYENIDALVDDYTNLPSAFEQYRRTAGEVEARNVQKRHEMASGDRKQTLAVETEDVARKNQIFLRENMAGRYQSLNPEESVKNRIEELFNQAISGEFKGKPVSIGRLTDEGKAHLEKISGISFKNKVDFVLNPSDLVHVYNDHFGINEKDKGQNIPLDIEDIRNLTDVISSPDKVVFFKEGEGNNRSMFYFFKEAEDGTYNLMEIYSDRKGNLTAKTFYKTRKGSNQRVIDIEKSLLPTSETSLVHPLSDAKIPQMFEFSNFANDFSFKLTENENRILDDENDIRYRRTKQNEYDVTPEAYSEMVEIREAAHRNGTFMLAPNGEPTNLSERQWLQVRTRAFKAWFGDWEKAARVEKLRKSSPVEISEDAHAGKYELDRKSAESYLLENLRGEYTILDTGDKVTIARRGAQKVLSHSAESEAHLRSIVAIPQLLEQSIFIEEEKPDKPNAKYDAYRYYVCGINIGDTPYTARITIGVKQGKYYYDHSLTDIEKGNLIEIANGFTPNGGRTLPPYAESKDTRIIPLLQTNASKVVDANGEPLVVYHGTPRDFTKFDRKFIGTYTDPGILGRGFYFSPNRSHAESYSSRSGVNGRIMELFVNLRSPLQWSYRSDDPGKIYVNQLLDKHVTDELFEDPQMAEQKLSEARERVTQNIIADGYDGVIGVFRFGDPEYVAFEPNQIKSATENDGSFSDEESDIRYRRRSGDIFYSNAEEAVWAIKQEKATPEQWLNMLQKSGGLKAGEDKWIGLSAWLKSSEKKSISKQEVLEYIAQNKIQIEETAYSNERTIETTPEFKELNKRYLSLIRSKEQDAQKRFDDFVRQMEVKYSFPENRFDTTALNETEYNVFSFLQRDITNAYIGAWSEMWDEYGDDFDIAFWNDPGGLHVNNVEAAMALLGLYGDNPINSTRESFTTKGLDGLREIALTVPTIESWGQYDEVHFGDAGDGRAIAWIRFGETEDTGGNRVLVIDEIQSKRHQEARTRGYKTREWAEKAEEINRAEEDVANATREVREYRDTLKEKYNYEELTQGLNIKESTRAFMDAMTEEERARYTELHINHTMASARLNELREEISGRDLDRMVPEAPFEKNWAELAMKRMLRYAAENGFDKIAWTTGQQQAERYDLSKEITRIVAEDNKIENASDGTPMAKELTLTTSTGMDTRMSVDANGVVRGREYDGKLLSDVIGKPLAEKLMHEGYMDISGEGLRIGGEGMKGFYDKMLVEFMNKYGKKWGVKVDKVNMPHLMENNTMHAVEVTDAMRESVMEGQPMFRTTKNPFVEYKITPRNELENKYQSLLQNETKNPNFAEEINKVLQEIRDYDARDFVAETYSDPLSDEHLAAVEDAVYDLQREYNISSQIRIVRDLGGIREAILREVLDGESYEPSEEELASLKEYIEERYTEITEGVYSHLSDVIILRADVARDKRYAGKKLFHEWTHAIEKRMREESKEFADLFEYFRDTQDLSYTRKLLPKYEITDDLEGRERGATELLARGVEKLYQWAQTDAYFGLEGATLDPVISYMEQREVPADLAKLITTCLKQIKQSKYDTRRDDGQTSRVGGYGPRYNLERVRRNRVSRKEVEVSKDVLETVSPGGGVSETRRLGNERGGGLQAGERYSRDLTRLSYPSYISTLKRLSARFGVPVEVVTDPSGLTKKKREALGWMEPRTGKVVIVLPNNKSLEEVEATYLHEVVGHYGLRKLLGLKFRPFLNSVWESLPAYLQQSLLRKHDTDRIDVAAEEYLSEIAETGNITLAIWDRIVAAIRKFFRDVLGVPLEISGKDIRYMLYLSKNNLESASSNIARVRIYTEQLRVKRDLDARYRSQRVMIDHETGKFVEAPKSAKGSSFDIDNLKKIAKGARKLFQDRMIHYKEFQDHLASQGVKIDSMTDFYNTENHLASKTAAELDRFTKSYIDPLLDVMGTIQEQAELDFDNICDYIAAETSAERHASGVDALSTNEEDFWNFRYVDSLIRETRSRISDNRNKIFLSQGYAALTEAEKEVIPQEILDKFKEVGFAGLTDHERFIVNDALINLLWERIRSITDRTLEYYVDSGLKTQEQIETIKKHGWVYYTPLFNFDTEAENMTDPEEIYEFIGKKTRKHAGLKLHKAEGRKTKPANTIVSMVNLAQRVIVVSKVNEAKQSLLRLLRRAEKSIGALEADQLWRMDKVYYYTMRDESGRMHQVKSTEAPTPEDLQKARELKKKIIEEKIELREINRQLSTLEVDREKSEEYKAIERAKAEWEDIDNHPEQEAENPGIRGRLYTKILDAQKAYAKKFRRWEITKKDLADKKQEVLNRIIALEAEETIRTVPGNFDFTSEVPISNIVDQQRIVEIYENGTLIQIKFKDPSIANAVNGEMSSQFAEYADKLLNKTILGDITRWRSSSVTTLSPDFLLRNGIRDFIHAFLMHFIDAENGQLRNFLKGYGAKIRASKRYAFGQSKPLSIEECGSLNIFNKQDRYALEDKYGKDRVLDTLYEYFVEEGGRTGFVHVQATDRLERDMRRSLASSRTTSSRRAMKSFFGKVFEGYKHLNETIEDATRFATFVANIEAGKDVFDATTQAKEITTNFNRRGELTGALSTIYMFYNPSMQGVAQLAKVSKKNPRRASVAALTLVAFGFGCYALKKVLEHDEDDDNLYARQIPDYLYDNNLVLPFFGRNSILGLIPGVRDKIALPFKNTWFFKIPMPNGTRFLYNWGTIIARAAYGEYDSWTKFVGDMSDAFLSEAIYGYSAERELARAFVPSFAQPFYDVARNMDAFGRPIRREDKYNAYLPDSELGMKNVNPLCYNICKALNLISGGTPSQAAGIREDGTVNTFLNALDVNPSNLEYIIGEFAGGPGKTALQLWRTVLSVIDGQEFDIRNIPVVNTIIGSSRDQKPTSEYYETKGGIETMESIYDSNIASGYMTKDDPRFMLLRRKKVVFDVYKKRIDRILRARNKCQFDSPEYEKYNRAADYLMRVANRSMSQIIFSDDNWREQAQEIHQKFVIGVDLENIGNE